MVGLTKYGFKVSAYNYIESALNAKGIHFVSDKSLTDNTKTDSSILSWVSVNVGAFDVDSSPAEGTVNAYILTRQDPEGLNNDKVFDELLGIFSDPTASDGNKRIPFKELNGGVMVETGVMWLARILVSDSFFLQDETKVCPAQLVFSWVVSL